MGTCFELPYAWTEPFPAGLDLARLAGFLVVALTPSDDAVHLDELVLAPGQRVVLVLGTEGPGLSEPTLAGRRRAGGHTPAPGCRLAQRGRGGRRGLL